jgi:hypothetical protein
LFGSNGARIVVNRESGKVRENEVEGTLRTYEKQKERDRKI